MGLILEVLAVAIAVGGIGTLARGKKISPVLAGGIAIGGFVVFRLGASLVLSGDNGILLSIFGAWGWVAWVAVFLRFIMTSGRAKPDTQWNCPNCRYLNHASSLFCEACQHPWQMPAGSVPES